MSNTLALVLMVSVLCLIISVNYLDVARSKLARTLLTVAIASLAAAIYVFAFPDPDIEFKGSVQETTAVVFCYLSMMLGMVAQYYYKQAERSGTKFEPMEFLMPLFASPIVFIPLLTLTTDISLSGPFTKSKLMVYLVAFQNGFFWKSFSSSGGRPSKVRS